MKQSSRILITKSDLSERISAILATHVHYMEDYVWFTVISTCENEHSAHNL